MNDREIKNARISGTMLGREDHGILTCMIHLDFKDGGQGFGGYAFDAPVKKEGEFKGRVGTAYGMEFIAKILKVVGVEKWEDLKGQLVRVDASLDRVHRIGNVIEDEWFDPDQDMEEFLDKNEGGK